MSYAVLQMVWVAAHHGLRADGAAGYLLPFAMRCDAWLGIHEITRELGYPPAPGPHEVQA